MNQGYSRITVEKAIELANKSIAEKIPLIKEKPQITYKVIETTDLQTNITTIPLKKKSWWKRFFD